MELVNRKQLPGAPFLASFARSGDSSLGNPSTIRSSQQHFKIDQRRTAVSLATTLAESALGIEPTSAGLGIEGIEADGIGGPGSDSFRSFPEQHLADAMALVRWTDHHVGEVDRLLHRREVGNVNRPGLLGCQAHGSDDVLAIARDYDLRVAHAKEDALFGRLARPGAVAVAESQVCGNRRVQRGQSRRVGWSGDGK